MLFGGRGKGKRFAGVVFGGMDVEKVGKIFTWRSFVGGLRLLTWQKIQSSPL